MGSSHEVTIQQTRAPEQGPGSATDVTDFVLPSRDVRRKRPAVLPFLLRLETLRRVARVVSLLALDFVGVAGALFTALAVKLAVHGHLSALIAWRGTRHW